MPPSWWWTPLRVALGVTVLFSVLAFMAKAPCLSHPYTDQYQYTHVCYTDTYALYSNEGLSGRLDPATGAGGVAVPYRDHAVEYPPVIGGLMWTAAELTNAVRSPSDDRNELFFEITALGLAACALVSTWTVARLAGRQRAWDAVLVAASPVLLLHAYTNWDMAAVAVTGLGLWAWQRRSPAAAGALLGVGIATKLYPVLVLLALVLLCARAAKWRAALTVVGTAVGGVVASYLPAVLGSRSFAFPDTSCAASHPLPGWRWFFSLSQIRGADWGSVWLIVQDKLGHPFDNGLGCGQAPNALNAATAAAVLVVVAGVAALVVFAPRRPRVGQVAFLLVAGFVMLNKVDSPQYALWLVPLAVLARPRWASLLFWQATEVLLGVANLYVLVAEAQPEQGITMGTYFLAIGLRDVVLSAVMALVVRDIWSPRHDVVRRGGVDDPAGGILDGAPDAYAGFELLPVSS